MSKEHQIWGKRGAEKLHSLYNSEELTRPARKAFLDKFNRQVDPNNELSETERAKRAEHAKKEHMRKLNEIRWQLKRIEKEGK
ncbi:MAG TPA: hypothetical protein VH186_32835 [Chloroflexia bacterium]|nr:hypothetical protein [Chloroflexia bacterium]